MKHIKLSTGKEVFIGQQGDGFTVANYKPQETKAPPVFRIDFPGGIYLDFIGKEADEMRDKMLL